MHELSIAQNIVETVELEAQKNNSQSIKFIKLKVGEFTGVVKEALEFSFEVAREGTLAANAVLEIEIIKLRKKCSECNKIFESPNDYNFFCPECGNPVEIISGRELQIEYIEVE